jgi:hypothetical protein
MRDSIMTELPSGPYVFLGQAAYKLALSVETPEELDRWKGGQINNGMTAEEVDQLEMKRILEACETLRAAWEARRITPIGYRHDSSEDTLQKIPHDISLLSEFLPLSRLEEEGCWLRSKNSSADPKFSWDGVRFPLAEIEMLIASVSPPHTAKRSRNTPTAQKADQKIRIRQVLAEAHRRWPDPNKAPGPQPMAKAMSPSGRKCHGYGWQTVRKILVGKYRAQMDAGIRGYFN